MVCNLLKSRSMSAMFLGEVVSTAIYLLNLVPTKIVAGTTPYEAWYGCRLDVHHLCTYGYVAYIKSSKPHLRKLDDRDTLVVFIGYEPGTKA
jgi:uncharacterized RmlC-like cupin family protein